MSEKVIPLARKQEPAPETRDIKSETIANLVAATENLDAGMKMAIDALVQMDARVRALELAQRKAERKNVPVIVNQHGERAN